jgi:hypothetical protein
MKKDEISEVDNIFENIYSWYQEYKEAWSLFEDIVIDTLGFEKTPEGPYRILKCDLIEPIAIAYVLNADCDLNSTVKGKYYVVDAVQFAISKNINWVIVTNGTQWRLYSTQGVSPYEFYFEVNIKDELETGNASGATRAFGKIFSAKAFIHDENDTCFMDEFKKQSDSSEENTEDVLRSKAERILKGLCYGLKDNINLLVFDEMQRKQIYSDAIVLLYRLLFLGYAEARSLLPVIEDDPDYQDSFSALCETARDYYMSGKLNTVGEDFDLWTRLDSQLRIYVDKNYNGGLFSNEDKPILKEYRIANKRLAVCLMELAYVEGKTKDYSLRIEYKDLSVRNLGAIYEGLLEYQLFIADELMVQRKSKEKVSYLKAVDIRLTNSDKNNLVQPGELYLSQEALERKETGAYYTPEDVVEYIVKNTVGVKLSELKVELDGEIAGLRDELSYEPLELNRKMLQKEIDEKTIHFINEKILSLSIIDSAMGSGHFLVNAAYQVANYIVNLLEANCWENEEINADVSYWKRRVVENCIYGIDINNLSVLLARLSLWLISASNDKALSFIDHHLKCGNSIVGTTVDRVQYYNKDIPIMTVSKEQYMYPVIKKYQEIKKIGSDSKGDVAEQHRIYDEITSDLNLIKRKLDYYLACQYAGGIIDDMEFYNVLTSNDVAYFNDEQFHSLLEYAQNNQFFHWEIEFPEVFMKGGFDIAIGNPPYIECALDGWDKLELASYSSRNMYAYMIENTIRKLKLHGKYGYIIPIAAFYSNRTVSFRRFILTNKKNYISNYGVRPAQIFKNAEQRVSIFFGERTDFETEIYTTSYKIWYKNERNTLFRNIEYVPVHGLKETDNVPKIGEKIEIDIYDKVYSQKHTLGEVMLTTKNDNNFVFHTAGGYWLKAFNFIPIFKNEKSGKDKSTKYQVVSLEPDANAKVVISIINSSLFYWCWVQNTAVRDFYRPEIERFPMDLTLISENQEKKLSELCDKLMDSYQENSIIQERNGINGKTVLQEFHPSSNKPIVDLIDNILAEIYSFSSEELEFIKNFQYRFRMIEEE